MRHIQRKHTLIALAIGSALSANIHAQEVQPGSVDASTEQAKKDGRIYEQIEVTALRRSQTLSSAPVAITAVSGDKLASEGVVNANDLPNVLPNVQVGVAGFSIRGVASADFTEKGDPSTAYNLDGIYIGRFTEQSLTMFDMQRVEVLRGPQGTLYGRNATAGVINVISQRPKDYFEASVSGEVANYNTTRSQAMVNVPVTDDTSIRVAGTVNKRDGFTKTQDGNGKLDDQNDYSVRASLLSHIGSDTSLFVSFDYAETDENGPASIASERALNQNDDHSLRYQNPGIDTYDRFQAAGMTVELNSEFDFGQLTYLFGFRESEWRQRVAKNDIPTQPPAYSNGDFATHQDHDQRSHELRLSSPSSSDVQWVAGLYYFDEYAYTAPELDFVNYGFSLDYDLHINAETKAAFAQGTYPFSDAFRATAGIRYSDDKKSRVGTQLFSLNNGFFSEQSDFAGFYPGGGISGGETTWKLGVEYDVSSVSMLYANITTGYKAGGFNDGSPADESPVPFYYEPETILSYELGFKGDAFDKDLYYSLTGFFYDYENLQLGLVKETGGQVTQNIPKANVQGIELEGAYRGIEDATIDYSFSYLNAEYDDFYPLQSDTSINFKGTPLDRSPEFAGRIAITKDFYLSNGGRISANAAFKYSESYVVTDGNTATQIEQESFTRTDMTLGYYSPGDIWYVQAFVKNLNDERQLGMFELGAFSLTDPRMFGVRAGYYFE